MYRGMIVFDIMKYSPDVNMFEVLWVIKLYKLRRSV